MITQLQILPSLYYLQRQGVLGEIKICALDSGPLRALAEDKSLQTGFPGQSFAAFPPLQTDPSKKFPDVFKEVIAALPKHSLVVVAVPDQVHYVVVKEALANDQHVCCVKPLVLKHDQAIEIEHEAYEKGLVVGVEYHKRFDVRALMARRQYRNGEFGDFRLGQAALHDPWYYRHSNFQNWCTVENSDMFTYIGCHYVDQVHFITGLLPTRVSVYGIVEKYPNGNDAYMWTDGRVIWENGACLNVQDSICYPDEGPGGNWQGIRMHFEGPNDKGGMLVHDDQYRSVKHVYVTKGDGVDDTYYAEPNPDFFRYIDLGGGHLTPTGYGFRSIEYIVSRINECRQAGDVLADRQALIKRFDSDGIMATPANSAYNELVMEACRLSITNDGREVAITYGKNAGVAFYDGK